MTSTAPSSPPHQGPRHETIPLRRLPGDEGKGVDLELAAQIINSGVLTAEISAANPEPDLAV